MELWDEIQDFGKLYMERVLVMGNEPVFFVCQDQDNQRYLFTACNFYEYEYTFTKVSNETLLKMLNNKITMESVYRNSDLVYITYIEGDKLMYSKLMPSMVLESKLPKKGEYFVLKNQNITEYIKILESSYKNNIPYNFGVWNNSVSIEVITNIIERKIVKSINSIYLDIVSDYKNYSLDFHFTDKVFEDSYLTKNNNINKDAELFSAA